MDTALDIIFIFVSTVLLTLSSVKMLHMYQLSSYRFRGVLGWLRASHFDYVLRYFTYSLLTACFMLLFRFCFPWHWDDGETGSHYFSYLFYVAFGIALIAVSFAKKAKVPLAVTPRMRRLILTQTVVCLAFSTGGWALCEFTPLYECGYAVLPVLIPLMAAISYFVTYPFERASARSFMRDASEEMKKLKAGGLIVVGITGSYGKTTAKNILCAMLSSKYRVCATPKSYNTPLGICRTINDVLDESDGVLLAEMGARRRGDIAEICGVAEPDYALITGVGCQHYETFGSLEAIADTKYELVEAVGENGLAVFNCADEGARALSLRRTGRKALTGGDGCDIRFSGLAMSPEGTRFTVTDGTETVEVYTPLLGRHIPALICACMAVAVDMGVPLDVCAKACEKLSPVEHRLEVMRVGDRVIIDDSYNSNPGGAANALEVLGCFPGKKVVVTPGMVELGGLENDANRRLGGNIAATCDVAVLVGSRAKAIKEGALEAGMDESAIMTASSLDAAKKYLAGLGECSVLFENDLPDNYV